jgi:hypothetical protein
MELLCKCLTNCLSNRFCCKNRIAEINPPQIRRDNKPEFVNVNDKNCVNEENEENDTYIKYIRVNNTNTRKHSYNSNYDDFDYNQPLPKIPQELHQNITQEIKQEIIYNTNLMFSNTEVEESQSLPPLPPLPPKVRRHTKSSILFH